MTISIDPNELYPGQAVRKLIERINEETGDNVRLNAG